MKPILNYVSNFDARDEYTFQYLYLGPERVTENELSIREAEKNSSSIYSKQVVSFDKIHILTPTLVNGKSYYARIRLKIGDVWGEWSEEVKFTCLSKPTFLFESLRDEKFVYNNDLLMTVVMGQEQGDKVSTYRFSLLDQNKLPVKEYPTRQADLTTPNVMTERVNGLTKGKLYYIAVYITTQNGLEAFSMHEFIPHFIAPSVTGAVQTLNQPTDGQVLVQGFLRQHLGIQTRPYIKGEEEGAIPMSYQYLNGEWVIIPPDRPLTYKKMGMAQASDFIAKIWCKHIPNGKFLEFEREDKNGIGMTFYKRDDCIVCKKEYLNEDGLGLVYQSRSNIVPDLKKKHFYLYIKVVEFRVDMKIEVVE